MSHSLEFRIPIAPTPAFYSNIRLAAASLAALGEPYASAPIVAAAGDNADPDAIARDNPWAADYPIRWFASAHDPSIADGTPPGGRGHRFPGFMGDRFPRETQADVVIHCDADVCVLRRFDELLDRIADAPPAIAGCMAHYSPFVGEAADNDATWRRLFAAAGLPAPALERRYSLAGSEYPGGAPPYFNAGFMVMNRAGWTAIVADIDRFTVVTRALLAEMGRDYFSIQTAISLAIANRGLEVLSLGLEYNCPNEDKVFDFGVQREEDVRVMHFLRTGGIDRHRFLTDPAAFEAFATGELPERMNRHLRRHILSLTPLCEALRHR